MQDTETVRTWQGRTLLDRDGSRIGTIDALYLDDRTGQPEWALVNTGLFGTKSSFVPLAQAFQSDNDVLVPYDKELVRDALRVDSGQQLSEAEERRLWQHYGLDEEEPRAGTTQRERSRVRLHKYVTTEHVEQAVPVRRERVRVEREPITDAATSGPDISEEEHEVALHKEEPALEKRVVSRGRVRLDKATVTGEERVAEEFRKERIEAVDDEDTKGGRHERRRRR
jgi:uncharacterized protein (TIGR02271 family)